MKTHYHLHITTDSAGDGAVEARLTGGGAAGGLRGVGASDREAVDHLLARVTDLLAGDTDAGRALLETLKEQRH